MNRLWLLSALTMLALVTRAHDGRAHSSPGDGSGPSAYQPAVPNAPQFFGGYSPFYSSPGTAAGSAMQGMANVISAAGSRNLSNSAAAMNFSQARKQEISNYSSAVDTYYQTRDVHDAYEKARRGPPPTAEELNRMAQQGLPKPLSPQQLDSVSGRIFWPMALQDTRFEAQRATMEKAFAWRCQYGAFNLQQFRVVEETTTAMLGQLKRMIRDLQPEDYVQAKSFIDSLAYAARQPVA